MAITPADLTAPLGDIEPSFFPNDDAGALTTRLQTYITDGTARANGAGVSAAQLDAAVKAWSYYRAYRAIWLRLSEAPGSVSLTDQGSKARTDQQREAFKVMSDEALALYNEFLPNPGPGAGVRVAAGAVRTRFTW